MLWTLALLACAQPPTDAQAAHRLDQVYDAWALTAPGIPTVDAPTLKAELESDDPPILVDVREPHERAVSTLPGALSLEQYEQTRETLGDRPIVVYCTVGVRSGYVTRRLAREGRPVRNFRGSILAWTHIGGRLVTPEGEPTDAVHVYGKRWNFANSAYAAYVGDPPTAVP
ncbi:MAG: rhodanese-like domain-containing protein [Myxococcota bacterium]